MSSKLRPHAYVVIDSKRQMPPELVLPDGYRPLPSVGEIVILEAGNTESRVKSIIDGPIEDILDVQHVVTGTYDADGDIAFPPGGIRLLNLIKLGIEAEAVLRRELAMAVERARNIVAETCEEYAHAAQPAATIQAMSHSRLLELQKEVTK